MQTFRRVFRVESLLNEVVEMVKFSFITRECVFITLEHNSLAGDLFIFCGYQNSLLSEINIANVP